MLARSSRGAIGATAGRRAGAGDGAATELRALAKGKYGERRLDTLDGRSAGIQPFRRHDRLYSTSSPPPPKCPDPACPHEPTPSPSTALDAHPASTALSKTPHPSYLNSLPITLRRLAAALPAQAGHPPSRDQLLALTTSFFERLKIRFKWATIRSYRRFRIDDYSAFFSVGVVGTLGWFLIGTTSFFAFAFAIVNSLSLQEWLARKLGDYLTGHTGVTVVFENAIVPKWGIAGGGSKILFKNVYISRGPTKAELGVLPLLMEEEEDETEEEMEERERMAKWTHFHLSIDSVEVSLSLRRWLDGKGLVKEATVTGVRGVVGESLEVRFARSVADFVALAQTDLTSATTRTHLEIVSRTATSLILATFGSKAFRSRTFSSQSTSLITSDPCVRLSFPRKDELTRSTDAVHLLHLQRRHSQVPQAMALLRPPLGRIHHRPSRQLPLQPAQAPIHRPHLGRRPQRRRLGPHGLLPSPLLPRLANPAPQSRFRVDGVPIDHMQSAHDTGVLSWVTSGRADLVADIRFPRDESELDLSAIVADIVEKLDKEIGTHLHDKRIPGQRPMSREALEVPKGWEVGEGRRKVAPKAEGDEEGEREEDEVKVSIDLDIRFKDLKASVPVRSPPPPFARWS